MQLTVVGSGDAFGSGGRLQTCFHIARPGGNFLIDCGATALIGMQQSKLDPNAINTIFISHLHGDHFSGLVWWLLHAEYVAKRTDPLTIIGPPGLEGRLQIASEALFPAAKPRDQNFEIHFADLDPDNPLTVGDIAVSVCEVRHPCGAPPYALRFQVDEKVIAFSGDTEWVEGLVDISRGADLFICECYAYERRTPYHISWAELREKLPALSARRLMLTHMNERMLDQGEAIADDRVMLAKDGLVLDV